MKPRVFLPAVASGVLLWAAFFPLNLGPLGFVALVPWLTLVRAPVSNKRRYFAAYVGGVVFFALATQWVRGSEWALAHARAFRDEVQQRVNDGTAACPGERARLMWVGAGLWHDTGFYTAFESSHRAVFVWSMYLAFGPDGYIRYGLDDPMAALASRTASFNEYLHNPPWAAAWLVHQARTHRVNGALVLRPRSMKPAATGRLFIERALEEAGIPVLPIEGDVVDARPWDPDAARAAVRSFLDARVLQ